MKNQYFGDINDYRKYGLLRMLSGNGKITTAVCWMLAADHGRTDGSCIACYVDERVRRRTSPLVHRRVGGWSTTVARGLVSA